MSGLAGLFPAPRKMTRRLCAVVLGGQAPVLLFGALGAWAIARVTDPDQASLYLWLGLGLAAACVVAAGVVRTRAGIAFGWLVQLATLASAIVVRPMLLVALIFGGLWVVALVQGRRMDDLTQRYVASEAAGQPGAEPSQEPSQEPSEASGRTEPTH